MSVARKFEDVANSSPPPSGRAALAIADGGSQPGLNGVLEQHMLLATAFATAPATAPYPGAVKLAIVIGAPIALWTGLVTAGSWLFHRL